MKTSRAQPPASDGPFDVAVIGAGVVGCAIARSFAVRGWRVVVLEKAADILEGASKGNSALLHTGYDEPEGSDELRILRTGFDLYCRIHARMNLPLLETGALVVAWSAEDSARLGAIRDLARRNGTVDARLVEPDELFEREPQLDRDARGAVLIPGEGVIDPWSAPLGYITQAVRHGARLVTGAELLAAGRSGSAWRLATSAGSFEARIVVNAAGLFGDRVERLRGAEPGFTVRPRKGQFIVFDKPARRLVNAILLKVPTARTKGVLIAPTVFGNLLLGPTAEDQEDRIHASCDEDVLRSIRAEGERMLPELAGQTVTACFSGLRPGSRPRWGSGNGRPARAGGCSATRGRRPRTTISTGRGCPTSPPRPRARSSSRAEARSSAIASGSPSGRSATRWRATCRRGRSVA